MLQDEFEDTARKVKLGKASEEAQAYLSGWLQKRCDDVWKKFILCKPELAEMLAVQAEGKSIADWQREIFLAQKNAAIAKKRFVAKHKMEKEDSAEQGK